MPWSKSNPPSVAKNWSPAAQSLCIRVANAALNAGKSDKDAIMACIGAVKRAHPDQIGKKNDEFALMFGDDAEYQSAVEFTHQFFDASAIVLKEEQYKDGDQEKSRFTSTFQVLPAGKFKHPWYGDLDFTAPVLRAMKRNFDNKVLGTDIMVDEGHDRGKALGWYKELHVGEREVNGQKYDGLWADVEWTDLGVDHLQNKHYKYFSAECGAWTGPSGTTVKNVLLGGGLTNRPFFKQMPAVKFSEGQATDRMYIGLFVDDGWAFAAGIEGDEDEEHAFDADFIYSEHEEESEEEQEPTEVSMDELIKEINAKYNKSFKTKEEVLAFLGTLHEGDPNEFQTKFRTAFGAVGLEFKDGEDPITTAVKALQAKTTEATALSERVTAIEKNLGDTAFEAKFSTALREGKVLPVQKENMRKLFDMDAKMFDDIVSSNPTQVDLEEHGHAGGGDPALTTVSQPFVDGNSEATQAEIKRYAEMDKVNGTSRN